MRLNNFQNGIGSKETYLEKIPSTKMVMILLIFMVVLTWGFLSFDFGLMAVASFFMFSFTLMGRRHILSRKMTFAKFLLLLVSVSLLLTFPFALYKTPTAIVHFGIGILSVFSAYVLSRRPNEVCRCIGVTISFLQLMTIGFLVTTEETLLPLDHMFEAGSSNGITSVLVVLQAIYLGMLFRLKRKVALFSSLITLGICVVGFSRGSILTAAALCLCSFTLLFFLIESKSKRLIAVLISVLVLGGVLIEASDYLVNFVTNETKLGQGVVDASRAEMYADYFSKINYVTFITGAEYFNTSIETSYNNNPHSSLIRAHHFFGAIYVAAIIIFVVLGSLYPFLRRHSLLPAIVILLIVFRTLSEPILFPSPLDFMFFVYIFIEIYVADFCKKSHD